MPTEEAVTFRPSEVLTLDDVARIENKTHGTIWTWAIRGRLKSHLVAGRYLVLRSDYEAFCRERENHAAAATA
jgi:hypothetical protein